MSLLRQRRLQALIFFILLIVVWELIARLGIWPPYIFPSPSTVGQTLFEGIVHGNDLPAIRDSLGRLLIGYFISIAIGLTVGMMMAQSELFNNTVGVLVLGLQTLPSICWLPLAILWFGLNERAILFVVIFGTLFSVAQSVEAGVRNTAPIYERAGRNLGAKGLELYLRVVLPAALPAIVTGMKLGWSFAWRSLMAGELLYSLPGLGNLLMMGRELNDMGQVMAVMIIIIALGWFTDQFIFGWLEERVNERWGFR